MEKDKLDSIEGINVPCTACKDKDEKPCEFCPYWQFSQLAYFVMKTNPMGAISSIIKDVSDKNNDI